ncbi:flavin-containing monooxygenase [Pseudomonas turukhanskensis]|uniref:Flavin-binding monooxygenase n=1 Tax=Pseudomonas turukhanskensis TaxID=1806536 RepID=A0A9W6K3V4_9PSED|nr:NAD(P)/FAD-dependent oxidoreductase [Pseudomonas turukhanskensis]GLK88277.1 flavin-binding monooxygenase [Pseudomonas turukhanskensis]
MATEQFDVLIIGAGLSGIGAAYRLQTLCPSKRYAILEGRGDIGGTWDLFRYPGLRSDSDMFTLGYPFRPWQEAKAIADGDSILRYIKDTARSNGIDQHIRFKQMVKSAAWSSHDALWTVQVQHPESGALTTYRANFLYVCSGYYDYAGGFSPQFPGSEQFKGQMIHPQKWPENLDYTDKNVVVIGSGATAVTLVPAMADKARHITMLQRSPSYIASLPARDAIADVLRKVLPEQRAHSLVRWKNVLLTLGFFQFCRRAPGLARKLLRFGVKRALPAGYAVDTHFNPTYQPWDQRLCAVPNGDLFQALKSGKAEMVTEQIDTLTETGIRLRSGQELTADIIITATGLKLQACGGMLLEVDGVPVEIGDTLAYKGMMLSNVPNFALCVGYTNASWTLRSDLASGYVCRVLNYMDENGYKMCVARQVGSAVEKRPLLDISAGYVLRAADVLPKQGPGAPWQLKQNYILDLFNLRYSPLEDGTLTFRHDPALGLTPRVVERAVSAA